MGDPDFIPAEPDFIPAESHSAASPVAPPPLGKPTVNMQKVNLLGGTSQNPDVQRPITDQVGELGAGALKSTAHVAAMAPVMLHRGLQSRGIAPQGDIYPGEHTTEQVAKQDLPNAALMVAGGMDSPEPELAPQGRPIETPSPSSSPTAPGMAKRVGTVLVKKIPGVKLASDLMDAVKGPDAPAAKVPNQAPVPETNGIPWGTGGQGPIDLRGKMIPKESANVPQPEPVKQPVSRVEASRKLQDLLGNATGAQELKPNVPLKDQLPALRGKTPDVTEGHTPVESSAMKSYQYDPAAKEFHAKYSSSGNTVHVFGDVSPEEAEVFNQAKSKGSALGQIQKSHPLVAKIVNGKRISVKGASAGQ